MADFTDLRADVEAGWKAQAAWREQADEDFAFVAGHQWTDDEKSKMTDTQRAPIVFNRVAVILSAVAGSEINNRTEVRFIPREMGDAKPNEVLTAGAEWFRDLAMAEDEESEAFNDLLTCGLGWTETTLDFEEDDEGEPDINRVDPTEMCWDPHARKKGLIDARWRARVRKMPIREALDRFPGEDAESINAAWLDAAKPATHTQNGTPYEGEADTSEADAKTVTVVQMQYRERVKSVEFMGGDGQRQEMSREQWKTVAKRLPQLPPHREKTQWVWKQVFLGARGVLDENQPSPKDCTFHAMTGPWDRKEKCFYGLLRSMRDPQKYANKWLSQTLHIVNSNAKGGVIAEEGVTDDPKDFEESWAAADGISWVKNGAMGRITEKPKAQIPGAFMGLTEFAISAIRDASGVNMELLGMRDANQPGVLEYQRRQSAMTTLARYFDSLRFYRKRQGGTILHFLRDHIAPTGRLVRIMKEGQEQYVPLAMDGETRKYDVIVDDAPSAPNEKEKAWSVIEAMMPMLQAAGLSMEDWADVLEYSPLPSSFVEKVRAKAEQAKQQQADPQQQQMQQAMFGAQLGKVQSEAMENQAQAAHYAAKAQEAGANAQLAPMKTLADLTLPMAAPQSPQGARMPPR